MSYPNVIYGDYGDEKIAQSTKIGNLPLGQLMILPDGRHFRHAKASATALVAGDLYQQNSLAVLAGSADANMINNLAASAMAVGATEVKVTLGGTAAVSKDLFADGFMFVAESAGQGITYKIKACNSAAAGSTLTITLQESDPIVVAVAASSSKIGLRQSSYHNVTLVTADTVSVGALAGIAPVAASASFYCWLQRSGEVCGLADATLVVGNAVGASSILAGAVGNVSAAGTGSWKALTAIGHCMNIASASTKYGLINLMLE